MIFMLKIYSSLLCVKAKFNTEFNANVSSKNVRDYLTSAVINIVCLDVNIRLRTINLIDRVKKLLKTY